MIGLAALRRRRTREVPCTVEIESSATELYAHVRLEGVEVGPGDRVWVHDAPHELVPSRRSWRRRATVQHAGPLRRAWTRWSALLELESLYEVGFSSRRNP